MDNEKINKIIQDDKSDSPRVLMALETYKRALLSLALRNGGEMLIPLEETDIPHTLMYRLEIIDGTPHYRFRVVADRTFQ